MLTNRYPLKFAITFPVNFLSYFPKEKLSEKIMISLLMNFFQMK